ncbi:MAG: deoxyribose-phosphate aldolase [Bacteroidetes bacterium CG23_combo_of_CG06-09_8_20_14_all_32_9]|nr:MAG: deoxyribose-phosphate aldolase [Bacteroidetes bacterium CG23_combo_of_CG06-09_8_20_14_all_32_9]
MEHDELIDKITKEVLSRLKEKTNAQGLPKQALDMQSNNKLTILPAELAGYIDHTLLKPDAVASQFEKLCDEAIKYKFKSVCINSGWVPFVTKKLRGTGVKICSVIGFPLGEMNSRSKTFEARSAIESGANEIDMVINVGALKSGNLKLVEEDIRAVRRACRSTIVLKVIIETVLLTDEEKILACEISKKTGADFVKTSTGFLGGGATVEDIILMRRIVGPKMGVKASGGIRTFDQAIALINAGANRLGCSASVAIVTSGIKKGNS